jgi:hypothetical protein
MTMGDVVGGAAVLAGAKSGKTMAEVVAPLVLLVIAVSE